MSSILKVGYPCMEELRKVPGFPSEERMRKGPVAVIECVQEIPCNPCQAACPKKAITIGENITHLPVLDQEVCIGCGICISRCPGLAIFVVNKAYSEEEATISFPFEYAGLPAEGDIVQAVNRAGKVVCEGRVVSVKNPPSNKHTPVVTLAIPQEFADEVRSMKRRQNHDA